MAWFELELVDDMAAFGWKQTNSVASTRTAQNATAIFLVINPLKPLKEAGCFCDSLNDDRSCPTLRQLPAYADTD
jgi:hypothetical protein